MARYDYLCSKCDHFFERNLPIDNRDSPINEPCSECGELTITRIFASPIINLGFRGSSVQSHAPTEFKEHLQKMKAGLGKRAVGIEV